MAEEQQSEKTEEATQTRREEFRRQGQVAQSRELASALFLLLGIGSVLLLGQFFLNQIVDLFQQTMGASVAHSWKDGDVMTAVKIAGEKLFFLIGPLALISLIIGLGSTLLQVGFLQVEDAFSVDFNKINPLEGFKRVFSLKSLVEAFKAVCKFILVGSIVYMILKSETVKIPWLIQSDVNNILSYLGTMAAKLFGGVGVAMAALTVADYFFQRWDLEKRMMMSKEEVKRETKEREGDPLIRSRIRRIQRDLANRRMMDKVPKADVIVTNPTHIAVALKYDDKLPAPQLVAKGADLVAERIKKIAQEHKIPIVENKPLARTIFKTLKIGQLIPRELFVAVAEVLSYVYRLKKKRFR